MKLTNIKNIGRYKNIMTGKIYNIKKGTIKSKNTDYYFYLYRGKRVYLGHDFFNYHKIQ